MQTALIVDDITENLYMLEILLKGNGFNVYSAKNGAEALEMARKNPPDLVVSDILMPVMDGYALCREWRLDETLKQIPFIFYTATFVETKDEKLALNLGADRFVIKPQDPDKLIEIINEVLIARKAVGGDRVLETQLDNDGILREYNEALFRKLEKKMMDLEHLNEELKRKNIEMEQFTYAVAHDLSSPLITIQTFAGYLKTDIASSDRNRLEEDLNFISSASGKMKLMLDELLEFSRIGNFENNMITVTFHEIIAETKLLLAGSVDKQKIDIKVSDFNPTLFGSHLRFSQVWENLIENAFKFMGNQSAPQVEIGCKESSEGVLFFVRDNGIGIDPKDFEKIFGMFQKLNHRTSGTGLGLTIAKRIVEMYGGRIWVESSGIGHGSCFLFTMPRAIAAP